MLFLKSIKRVFDLSVYISMTVFGSAMPAEGGAAPSLNFAFVGPHNFTGVNSAHQMDFPGTVSLVY